MDFALCLVALKCVLYTAVERAQNIKKKYFFFLFFFFAYTTS